VSDTPPWPEGTLDAVLGFETVELGDELARARAKVGDQHKQPFGLVHGGVYAAMAESMSSVGTAVGVGGPSAGMSNFTNFLKPVTEGTIHAVARPRHRGRTTWVWDTEFTDDAGRVCAISRVTIAVLSEFQKQ
jgi:uncharacterized protein (TIGR00369 family)